MVPAKVIDLFSGCGGLSLGMHTAAKKRKTSIDTLASIDMWKPACLTQEKNLKIKTTIAALTAEMLDDMASSLGRPDILVGGPPCQGFSSVGRRALDDPRNLLVKLYVSAVKVLRPKIFLMENVNGFVTMQGGAIFEETVLSMRALGYGVYPAMLTASAYGVPQHRRRCFIVGVEDSGDFQYPTGVALYRPPKHSELVLDVRPSDLLFEEDLVSFNQATSDLPALRAGGSRSVYKCDPVNSFQRKMRKGAKVLTEHYTAKYGESLSQLLPYIPKGASALDPDVLKSIPKSIRPTSGFGNSYSRINGDRPSPTITRNFGAPSTANCIHPTANRALSIREASRCQSFPDSFEFVGTAAEKKLQIGNAVPPLLAQALCTALLTTLDDIS